MVKILNDRILAKRDVGVIENNNDIVTGKVIGVGDGYLALSGNYVPTGISVGDTIAFHSQHGEDIVINEEVLTIIKADSVYYVL